MLFWGLCMVTVIIYQVVTVPFYLAFDSSDTLVTLSIDFVCTVLYILDVFVTANTAFYKRGMLITDRKEIFRRYAHTWLVVDVFSSFPYSWVLEGPMSTSSNSNLRTPALLKVVKISRLLRTFRLVRITKVRMYLSTLEQKVSSKISILLTIIYLCVVMTAVAHWAACGFYYMSQTTDDVSTWIYAMDLNESAALDQYVTALYWAITTLTTTGYGDIVPISTNERIYVITIMILSAGVFSYLVGKIGTVISLIERESSDHKDLVMEISRYLKSTEVPLSLTYRALRYIDYKWETRKKRKELDKRLLGEFSEPLKNEISETIFGKILTRVPMMNLFDRNFISQMARSAEPTIFAQDDIIFEMGDTSEFMYFLERGRVEMFDKASKHTFQVLQVRTNQKGVHFGEIGFYSGIPRTASVRCIKFTETLCVSRDRLMGLIRLSPSANYTLQLINDKIMDKDFKDLGITCYLCKQDDHLAYECKLARIQINKEMFKQHWLKGRDLSVKKISRTQSPTHVSIRRQRKVNIINRYSVKNVKSDSGWKGFRHASSTFSNSIVRNQLFQFRDSALSRDRKDGGASGSYHRGSAPPISLEAALFSDVNSDNGSPPISPQRRYSVIGGVRTYQLRDEIYARPEQISEVESSSSSSDLSFQQL